MALPLWAATSASGFFAQESVQWRKSLGCLGCWSGLVGPALVISVFLVWAQDWPQPLLTVLAWSGRVLIGLCFLPIAIHIIGEIAFDIRKKLHKIGGAIKKIRRH